MNGVVSGVIGYKEWEAVCDALGSGGQCVLLRKGGIHEGRDGFSFKHEHFFLFPSRFHAQGSRVTVPVESSGEEWAEGDEVPIRCYGEAVWARTLTDWEQVCALAPFHVWKEDLVRERFDCGEDQQIHCALVRVYVLPRPWILPYEKKFGGCRTWIDLPAPPSDWRMDLQPVMGDDEFAARRVAVEEIVA